MYFSLYLAVVTKLATSKAGHSGLQSRLTQTFKTCENPRSALPMSIRPARREFRDRGL